MATFKSTTPRVRLITDQVDDLRKEVAALRERVDVLEKTQPAPLLQRLRKPSTASKGGA